MTLIVLTHYEGVNTKHPVFVVRRADNSIKATVLQLTINAAMQLLEQSKLTMYRPITMNI